MCGYYYSTHTNPQDTRNLRRRGPEGWQTRDDELGKFGHALLNTIGEKVHQPLETPHGVLLYNGSVYNSKPYNDALWIADNLSSNVDQCMEFVRTLNGEYSITWVTEQFVIFCTDPFGTRPLYHHQYPDGGIHTASLMDVFSGPQMLCDPNVIYVYHRKRDSIEMHVNNTWDLTQRVDSWDQTWESFDRAVMDRHDDSVYAVSGGHDSGAIMASAVKQFGPVLCVNTVPNGEQKILAQRCRINPIQPVSYTSRLAEVDMDQLFGMTGNSEIKNKMATCGQTAYIRKVMLPRGRKVLVTGEGGDEIYSDYGHNGTRIRDHSKTGGHFPANLETAWPWYNNQQVLSRYVGRTEAVGGHWGVELRLPLLDKRLVQAWLNTTHRLKNSGYKSWMAQYMEDHGMPYEPHAKSGYSESTTQTMVW
jgi:asparagine synthetase B (glutamine-hydrolysing)